MNFILFLFYSSCINKLNLLYGTKKYIMWLYLIKSAKVEVSLAIYLFSLYIKVRFSSISIKYIAFAEQLKQKLI